MLLNSDDRCARDKVPTLRFVTSSSAPLLPEEWRRFEERFGIPVAQGYGSSETGWIAAIPGEARRLGTVGMPLPYHDLAHRRRGGTAARAPARSARSRSAASATTPIATSPRTARIRVNARGRIRTGDLGFLDEEGYLHLTGREKEIIIRGGVNISPVEIDSLLMQRPDADRGRDRRRAGRDLRRGGGELRGGAVGPRVDVAELLALLQHRAARLQGAEADRAERVSCRRPSAASSTARRWSGGGAGSVAREAVIAGRAALAASVVPVIPIRVARSCPLIEMAGTRPAMTHGLERRQFTARCATANAPSRPCASGRSRCPSWRRNPPA